MEKCLKVTLRYASGKSHLWEIDCKKDPKFLTPSVSVYFATS